MWAYLHVFRIEQWRFRKNKLGNNVTSRYLHSSFNNDKTLFVSRTVQVD